MKKVLGFILIISMFLLVSSLDTVDTTSQTDIASAQMQAQINKLSK